MTSSASRSDRRAGLRDSPRRAMEATLRADLFTFRSVIDQYKATRATTAGSRDPVKDGYMPEDRSTR
jgi:hypothetical protein